MKRYVRITGINTFNSDFIHSTVKSLEQGLGIVVVSNELDSISLLIEGDITSDESDFGYVPSDAEIKEALLILATLPLATDVVVTVSQELQG